MTIVSQYILNALKSFKDGKPILVHDSKEREDEVDIFVRASMVTVDTIKMMRKDGGGLLCVALHSEIAKKLELPFLHDLLRNSNSNVLRELVRKDIPYDRRSSFSITVNHKKTRTGITDLDRALTVRELGKMCKLYWENKNFDINEYFIRNFRAPGHVHLLRGAEKLLEERKGHTELALTIALLANVEPCVALIEMLSDNGKALSLREAEEFARLNGLYILDGAQIEEIFVSLKKKLEFKPILI